MKQQDTTSISTSVMDKIKNGQVHMRPRLYYAALSIVTIGAVILSGITVTYLLSIAFFWLRIITSDTMAYGARANFNEAIASFPWWTLALAALLLTAAILLVRKQGRIYKHKTSSIVILIIISSLVLGFGLSFVVMDPHTPGVNDRPGQGWREKR